MRNEPQRVLSDFCTLFLLFVIGRKWLIQRQTHYQLTTIAFLLYSVGSMSCFRRLFLSGMNVPWGVVHDAVPTVFEFFIVTCLACSSSASLLSRAGRIQ